MDEKRENGFVESENPTPDTELVLTEENAPANGGVIVDGVPNMKKKTRKKSKAPKTLGIAAVCVVLAVALFAGVWVLFSDYWLKMKDVTVAGIKMEGMTKVEAKDALTKAVDGLYKKQNMTVTVMDTTLEIQGKDAGIAIDVEKAIDKAYHKSGKFDIAPYITTGKGVDQVVSQLVQKYNTPLEQTVYNLEGNVPDLKTSEEGAGQTLKMTIGQPQIVLKEEDLRKAIRSGYGTASFEVTGECVVTPPEMLSANELYEKFLTAPIDAALDEKWQITPETYGYSVNVEKAEEAVADLKYGDSVSIPFSKIAPQKTEASILAELYKDVLGECSTPYSGSDNNNRNTNLRLACEKINGRILLPGESFSYNQTLGPRTAAGGWKTAGAYANGESVDVYGGGICQGSTTLYNCVAQADLQIDELHPHSYVSSYIGKGLDATVSWGGPDFRFTNSYKTPIKIEAYRTKGKMTFRIYGIDDKDYYVKMSSKVLSTRGYSTIYIDVDSDNNPNGYRDGQVLTSPYSGCHVQTFMSKYDKKTNELIETKQVRDINYKSRNKEVVRLHVKTPPTPETPDVPTPPPAA